jgi:riboflavin-specific deaminase-like protein
MELRRIHPDSAAASPAAVAAAVREEMAPPAGRPYLALNFASTADGRITVGGRSGPIGNEADRELFHELRAQADAVMAGAGTVGTERYGRLIRDPERRARRADAGLDPDPLAVLVTARLTIGPDVPLLQDPDSRVVIVTASDLELAGVAAQVEYLRPPPAPEEVREPPAELELAPLMGLLRERHGVELVLCEGGSVLAGALLRERLVDELFLSLAPKLAGGPPLTILTGDPLAAPLETRLVSLYEHESHLFGRYRLQESLQALE